MSANVPTRDDEPEEERVIRLELEAARLVCELLGHDWQTVRPREGTAIAAILGPHVLCVRCCKLNR